MEQTETIDGCAGIEAVRAAWTTRPDGFRALYEESGPISSETDAKVAEVLSTSLRAAVTGNVVGHFRREIGMTKYQRRSADPESTADGRLPYESSVNAGASPRVLLMAAAIQGLCARVQVVEPSEIARVAAVIADDAMRYHGAGK